MYRENNNDHIYNQFLMQFLIYQCIELDYMRTNYVIT